MGRSVVALHHPDRARLRRFRCPRQAIFARRCSGGTILCGLEIICYHRGFTQLHVDRCITCVTVCKYIKNDNNVLEYYIHRMVHIWVGYVSAVGLYRQITLA